MTAEQFSFDETYFPTEIEFWYSTKEELSGIKGNFDAAEDVPELSPKLSDALDMLIPALNQAKADISFNMGLAAQAADAFATTLTQVAVNYGMTEDEAQAIANRVGRE